MDMKTRHYHTRLCEKYVERFHPEDYKALERFAIEGYKTGKLLYSLKYAFSMFLTSKEKYSPST
jgi:hypothetical protein